ncbi:MAG: hypothetical protein U9R25_14505 [Chloroflexota bacterium]|nr:hypothetical protein [Chloroflexota bacterium]
MASWTSVGHIWKMLGEIDLMSLRDEALLLPRLALLGPPDKVAALQAMLQQGPHAIGQPITAAPVYRLDPARDEISTLARYDLVLVLFDSLDQLRTSTMTDLVAQSPNTLLVLDKPHILAQQVLAAAGFGVEDSIPLAQSFVVCALDDPDEVEEILYPRIVAAFPDREVALARAYPALRPVVAKKLVNDTSVTNAAYSFGTGIGELVPGLLIPLTVADSIVLTKNQLLLAYKIGLLMGETGTAREVIPQLAAVVGFGFIWRQMARSLVGLLPGIGLVPKVGIAYAGTYAIGQMVYQWYVTGVRMEGDALREVFAEAVARGREYSAELVNSVRQEGSEQTTTGRIARAIPRIVPLRLRRPTVRSPDRKRGRSTTVDDEPDASSDGPEGFNEPMEADFTLQEDQD